MDLETIGKQILEALAVQGQIAGIKTKLAGIQTKIIVATNDICRAKDEEERQIKAHKQAEDFWVGTVRTADIAREAVIQAEAKYKLAELAIEPAEEEVSMCDTRLNELFEIIPQLEEVKKAFEVDRDEILEELEEAGKNLEARQEELKVQGIEINIGSARPPKVMVL